MCKRRKRKEGGKKGLCCMTEREREDLLGHAASHELPLLLCREERRHHVVMETGIPALLVAALLAVVHVRDVPHAVRGRGRGEVCVCAEMGFVIGPISPLLHKRCTRTHSA